MVGRMRTTLAIGLVTIAAISGPAAAAPGGTARPFNATLSGVATPTLEPRCGADLALALTMSGNATHLGVLSAVGTHCTSWALTQMAVPFYSGVATFAAADGSTLVVTYAGWQQAPVGPVAELSVEVEVAAGTGRFAGVEGAWAGGGVIDFSTFAVDATLSGWISY